MKNLSFLLPIVMLAMLVSCTDLREKDVPRLVSAAEKGDNNAAYTLWRSSKSQSAIVALSPEQEKAYEKRLLESGNRAVIDEKMKEEGGEKIPDDVRLKWLKYGAEHGSVPCMVDLGGYYHKEEHYDVEQAMYWTKMAADSCSTLAKMRLLWWQDKSVAMHSRAFRAGAQGWKVNGDGSWITQLTGWSVYFFSVYVYDIFAFLFSSNWWQGLLGALVLALFLGLFVLIKKRVESSSSPRMMLPMLWTGFYGAFNGLFMVINEFGGFMYGNWIQGENSLGLNVGRFSRRAAAYSQNSDMLLWASWIWLIVFVVLVAYLLIQNSKKAAGNVFVMLAWVVFGSFYMYVLGAALSLLSLVAVVVLIFKFVYAMMEQQSSEAASSSYQPEPEPVKDCDVEIEADYGDKHKLWNDGYNIYKDENGDKWRRKSTTEFERYE